MNSYLYDISMECKVYFHISMECYVYFLLFCGSGSSLPPYQFVMKSSVVILGFKYQPKVNNATS